MGSLDADGIHHGIDGHSGELLLLLKRDSEFVECIDQFRIDLIHTLLQLPLFRGGIIGDRLKVDLRDIEVRPLRRSESLPIAECLETEVKQPIRLTFESGNKTHGLLRQTRGHYLRIDV